MRTALLVGAALTCSRYGVADGPDIAAPDAREPSSTESRRLDAQRHFERGLALARTGKSWDEALAEFQESRRLFPTRSASRNAAIALRQLGRYADALALYDALLSEFADSTPRDQHEAFVQERRALLERIGELEVRTTEVGVSVVLDGEHRGKTPLEKPLLLDAGAHVLRLSKEGFETYEGQVSVAAGARRLVESRLRPEVGVGTLVVAEANGEELNVVLDGAVVGRTPWQGSVAPGLHSVLLRGDRRGTAPKSVEVKLKQRASVTVVATVLDAEALIVPVPADATIFVDGVFVGNGTWRGFLPNGAHRFEVVAPGHLPFRRDVRLGPHSQATVRAQLERNPSVPAKVDDEPGPIYVEPALGLIASRSLGGGADECTCSERSRPFGWLASARAGYTVKHGPSIEVGGGYWSTSQTMIRRMVASGEPGTSPFVSSNYADAVDLAGPFGFVAVSERLLRRTPLTARLAVGLSSLSAETSNDGTFTGHSGGTGDPTVTGRLQIEEPSQRLLTPFVSTELRFGYQVGRRLSMDLGVALTLLLPPSTARADRAGLLQGLPPATGVFTLEAERIAGPFLAVSPSVGARWQF